MAEEKILLLAADTTPLADPACFAAACAAASPARRKKADALRREADKRRCLAAGLLLQRALGVETEPELGPCGKPCLPGGPRFSLSHSGDFVLCAVGPRELGCDIQRMGRFDLRVARRYFAPEEYADVLAQADPAERFYRYWTLKESFAKALGLGLHLPFREFRMVLDQPVTVEQHFDGRDFGFAEFADIPGYRCALCAEGGCGNVKLEIVSLFEENGGARGGSARLE